MAEYVAGRGTTALGIIGTVLGGIGTAAAMGTPYMANGYVNGYAGNANCVGYANGYAYAAPCYQKSGACMHDIETTERMAEKDAKIAKLESERYADGVRDDAKQYGIEIYKELKDNLTEVTKELTGKIDFLKEKQNEKWTDQAVINANITNGITALNGQVQATSALVAQITKTAVPRSAICDFSCGCNNGCGNNI